MCIRDRWRDRRLSGVPIVASAMGCLEQQDAAEAHLKFIQESEHDKQRYLKKRGELAVNSHGSEPVPRRTATVPVLAPLDALLAIPARPASAPAALDHRPRKRPTLKRKPRTQESMVAPAAKRVQPEQQLSAMVSLVLQNPSALETLRAVEAHRGVPMSGLLQSFLGPGKSLDQAHKECISWATREGWRRRAVQLLPPAAVEALLDSGVCDLPGQPVREKHTAVGAVAWKAIIDPEIGWATQQAKQRLVSSASAEQHKQAAFQAEVWSWLKRAVQERLVPRLLK
eukprot:TRINITY_DN62243_c0_g1_i1.p1 TRINITY_DN62243_c0_g1~~TRINITY_DN62243_c0_g1_i1.p1  ORF type:complete len:284 (+),score=44.95 TRINITY_DN62243_c0_g1_i1:169-1020(+)